ncbi:MAG: hypothetical protein ACKPKO_37150, partial [Candidatus Fonsibacter sp.]
MVPSMDGPTAAASDEDVPSVRIVDVPTGESHRRYGTLNWANWSCRDETAYWSLHYPLTLYIADGAGDVRPVGRWTTLTPGVLTLRSGHLVYLPAGYQAIWTMQPVVAPLWSFGHVNELGLDGAGSGDTNAGAVAGQSMDTADG